MGSLFVLSRPTLLSLLLNLSGGSGHLASVQTPFAYTVHVQENKQEIRKKSPARGLAAVAAFVQGSFPYSRRRPRVWPFSQLGIEFNWLCLK